MGACVRRRHLRLNGLGLEDELKVSYRSKVCWLGFNGTFSTNRLYCATKKD